MQPTAAQTAPIVRPGDIIDRIAAAERAYVQARFDGSPEETVTRLTHEWLDARKAGETPADTIKRLLVDAADLDWRADRQRKEADLERLVVMASPEHSKDRARSRAEACDRLADQFIADAFALRLKAATIEASVQTGERHLAVAS